MRMSLALCVKDGTEPGGLLQLPETDADVDEAEQTSVKIREVKCELRVARE